MAITEGKAEAAEDQEEEEDPLEGSYTVWHEFKCYDQT